MQKILAALALGFAVQAAVADTLPAGRDAGAPAAGGLMHATLVVPAQPAGGAQHGAEPPALPPHPQAGAEPAAKAERHGRERTTTGLLLAGLALMAGIVLRRWGTDRR